MKFTVYFIPYARWRKGQALQVKNPAACRRILGPRLAQGFIPVIAILFCGFLPQFLQAEPVEVLNWQDCVNEALKNNPDLLSGKQDVLISIEKKHLTQSSLFPQVSANAQRNWSDQNSNNFSSGTSLQSGRNYSYGVSAQQLLFDGFKTVFDAKAASQDLAAVKYGYAVTSADVRYQLRTAFIALLKAQDMVALTKNIAARRSQNYQLIKLRYQAGREHKGSLLTAQANLTAAQVAVTQAERDLGLSQRLLLFLLGRDVFSPVHVKESIVLTSLTKKKPDFELLANAHPSLKQASAQKDSSKYSLSAAKSDFFPEINLNTSMSLTGADFPADETGLSAVLTVNLPLFEGGSQFHQIQKSKAELKKAQINVKSTYNDVAYTLHEKWTTWQNAIDSYQVQGQYLTAASERSKIANAQYSTGLITFNDWTIIEDNLVSAQKSSLTAKMDILLTEADWLRAKGETLDVQEK